MTPPTQPGSSAREPGTEAGREMHVAHDCGDPDCVLLKTVLAIEAQARAKALRDARLDDGQMELPYIRGYNAGFDDAWQQQVDGAASCDAEVRALREALLRCATVADHPWATDTPAANEGMSRITVIANKALRRELWLHHGHDQYLYGDDGDMQCIRCTPTWDYLRAPLAEVLGAAESAQPAPEQDR